MTPFRHLLSSIVDEVPEASGALFLDESGETVDLVSESLTSSDLKVLGAYLSIALRRTRHLYSERRLGRPESLQIEHDRMQLQIRLLPDGYYLVLLQRRPGPAGIARWRLDHAARRLAREIAG